MGLWNWSTTAANNATADPSINWQEGQAPSTVNDSARAMMAAIAVQFQTGWEWQEWGDTPTYVSGTQFTVPGNLTGRYTVGRRVRASVTAGTVYGTIANSVYSSLTTVTLSLDSGSLDSSLSEVDLGILNPANSSFPTSLNRSLLNVQVFAASGTYTPTPGATKAIIEMVGGGGQGGGAQASSGLNTAGSGGGAAASARIWIPSALQSYAGTSVTIGAGGTGAAAGANGNAGGATTFGALASCGGGVGGLAGLTALPALAVPNNAVPAFSSSLTVLSSQRGDFGGAPTFQGATNAWTISGAGASSPFGSGGIGECITNATTPAVQAGSNGTGYGAGGGAAAVTIASSVQYGVTTGFNGSPGVLIVYEFI